MSIYSRLMSWVIRLVLALLGLVLIFAGNIYSDVRYLKVDVGNLLADFGALVLVLVVLQWVFDAAMRGQLITEVAIKTIGYSNVANSGIVDFVDNTGKIQYDDI